MKNYRFSGQLQGGKKGLWLSNLDKTDTHIVIAESVLDCLSYHILHGLHGDDRTRYVSFGGGISRRQRDLIEGLLHRAKEQGRTVVVAVDNDSQGREYRNIILSLALSQLDIASHLPQEAKDWNDAVQIGQAE